MNEGCLSRSRLLGASLSTRSPELHQDFSDRLTACEDVSYSQAFSGKGTTVVVCMPTPNRAKAIQGLAST